MEVSPKTSRARANGWRFQNCHENTGCRLGVAFALAGNRCLNLANREREILWFTRWFGEKQNYLAKREGLPARHV